MLSAPLEELDPAVYDILQKEKKRQKHFINLIPSENFTSQAVLDALGSVMQSQSPCPGSLALANGTRQVLRGLSRSEILWRKRIH